MSPFLSRLACWILGLTDKHGITLLPAYIPTHLNVEADYRSQNQLLLEWHLLPQVAQEAFHLWGLPEVDLLASSHSTQCQHYFTLETPLPLGALGLNTFSHPWTFQVSYVFPPPALVPLVLFKFLAEHVNSQTQSFDSGGTMLDGGSLASHSSQHVGRCSLVVSHHKRSRCGCFSRSGTQGSAISTFNTFGSSVMCAMQTLVLFLSQSGGGGGNSNIYIKGLSAVLERMGQLMCLTECTKQCHLCP